MRTAHSTTRAHQANAAYGVDTPSLQFTAAHQGSLERIAAAYDALPSFDGSAVYAWSALERETLAQFDAMGRAGIRIEVQDTDPYASAAEMMADVERGVIRVLSTESTGGHPYWSNETNDVFRAVHDVMGHAATGRGFDRHGEARAYEHHATSFSPLARMALATELRGQAAYVAVHGEFPEQKIGILPREIRELSINFPLTPSTAATPMMRDAIRRHLAGDLHFIP